MNHTVDFYDPAFLEKLRDIHIVTRTLFHGRLRGKRRSLKKGTSLEFADFKRYTPGDDFRFIDINILARLQKYMIRSFWDEENLYAYLFVDTSRSMSFGKIPKLIFAKKVAAALASTILINHDTLAVGAFTDRLDSALNPITGEQQLVRCFEYLNGISASGKTNLHRAISQYALTKKDKGILIIISDMLDLQGYRTALTELLTHGFEVHLIHITALPELENGVFRFIDSETGETVVSHIDEQFVQELNLESDRYSNEIKRFCHKRNIRYFTADTQIPFEEFVLSYFKSVICQR